VAAKRMTKHDIMRIIQKAGRQASFVGNVILCHHRRPWTKLRGLAQLILDGHDVRAAQFDLDVLVVDGQRTEWAVLEQ